MERRRTHHGRHVQKPVQKGQTESRVLQKKLTIGKPYSAEQIQKLIAALTSRNRYTRITAIAEFAENNAAVTEAAASLPDISATVITEDVIKAVLKNEKEMFERFEKEMKTKALSFLAESSAVPKVIRQRAASILQRLPVPQEKVEEPKLKKKEEPELVAAKEMYTPPKVKALIKALGSRVKEIKISAAIQFIRDYAKITPTVAKMPLLTVTAVTAKAVEVIKKDPKAVIDTMVKRKMLSALTFLSSLAQVPLDIRDKAAQAAEKLKAAAPIIPVKAAVREPVVKEEAKEPFAHKDIPTSKEYTPLQLEALLNGLESIHRARAIRAATEFLRNYEIITDAISKAPMLTVTDVTRIAVTVVESNLGVILKELKKQRDLPALNLLANSSKFSSKTRKKAAVVLKMLIGSEE